MCQLVEVFSIKYIGGDGAAPSGTISVFDGKRGQIIYTRPRGQKASRDTPSISGVAQNEQTCNLLLMGPYRAISADGCVALELDLHHGCSDNAQYVAQILLDIYDPSTKYDEIVKMEVSTCTCKDSPRAQVKYALLSDAVEAMVEVKLLQKRDGPVYGKITARSDLGKVVLFESTDDEESIHIRSLQGLKTTIPLTRSVHAVPLTSSLKIDVALRIPSTGETVEDSVECTPDLEDEHRLVGQNGEVEVKITWSD